MLKRINRFTDEELFVFLQNNEQIIQLLQVLEIIPEIKNCDICNKPMKLKYSEKYEIKKVWKCSKCKGTYNILNDTPLKGKFISAKLFLKFAFYFFEKNHFSREYIMKHCKIGEDKYKTLINLFRERISDFVKNNKKQLGGFLKEVQIDETFWAKRKYGVGNIGKQVWIFGAVEYKSGRCYCEVVDNRQASTLLPIIEREILKKTYIVSDKWSVYQKIQDRYTDSVNHKHFFVDPITKANTQKIENLWMHLKKIKHYSYGISLNTLADHLNVFMFFRNYKDLEFTDFIQIILK
ncbi:hypothetical protein DMUE_6033 [Dictyocoela muelleri]|nr:hypothetical protein DMUE_6033 [Dictyocoela muelleri]